MKVLTILLVFVLLALQYRLWVGEGSFADVASLNSQIAEQRRTNTRLKTENAQLLAEVKALKNGDRAIEGKAREELGMIGKDETFYLVVDAKTSTGKSQTVSQK